MNAEHLMVLIQHYASYRNAVVLYPYGMVAHKEAEQKALDVLVRIEGEVNRLYGVDKEHIEMLLKDMRI